MATLTLFHQFVEDVAEGVHDLGTDTITVALSNAAPNQSTAATLSDITEISYTNVAGSRDLTLTSSSQTSGTYRLILADLTITASGGSVGPFQYIVFYNNSQTSPADPLIGYVDRGSALTLADGESVDIDLDGTNGLWSLAVA